MCTGTSRARAGWRSAPADGLRATYDLVGYDEDLSPTNTAARLAGLKRDRTFILHKDLTACWVGDQADALVAGDHWSLDAWQLKLTRPLDAQPVSGQRQILEPLENDGAVAIETGNAAPLQPTGDAPLLQERRDERAAAVQDECELTVLNV